MFRVLACSRTMRVCESAWITSALSHTGLGFLCFTTSGGELLICARAEGIGISASARASGMAARILELFIEGNLQGLQKLDVLRGDLHPFLDGFFFQDFVVHADVQRFQE